MLPLFRPKQRVLVLDDDPSMQRLIALLLKRAGYRPDVVSKGNAAIDAIAENDYRAILLDLMMPHEGGMTVIRHLRAHAPKLLERVVVVTAAPDPVMRTVEGDIAAVVRKPFAKEELIGAVKRIGAR